MDLGLTLFQRSTQGQHQNEASGKVGRNPPFSEELENLVLAFFGEPRLVGDEQFDLLEVNIQDLWGKDGHEMLGECTVLLLHGAGQLGRVTEALPPHQSSAVGLWPRDNERTDGTSDLG